MTIYINKKYGAKIGNIQVFTKERAIEVFKLFVDDMNKIGFSYEELEQIEMDIITE